MSYKKSFLFVWILAFSLLCTSLVTKQSTDAAPSWEQKANKVISVAKQNSKKKYQRGKAGPDKFDCSGFTQYVFKKAINNKLPRSTKDQVKKGKKIAKKNIRKGDLLFFKTNGKNVSHVGIYIGNGKMIHAANERKNITTTDINISYWKKNFVQAKRFVN